MSAIGPKQTCVCALHESAFGGEADMTVRGCLLSRSLLGVKRTCPLAFTCLLLTQSGHHLRTPAWAKASGSYASQSWPSGQLALVAQGVDNLSGQGAVP